MSFQKCAVHAVVVGCHETSKIQKKLQARKLFQPTCHKGHQWTEFC
jgi:hypothetical protein